jgi:predicted dithiol-disulfide oxidoreductase (DUF899 family)
MSDDTTGTSEAWLARLELLEAEKELTRRSDELARRRHELPWVRVAKEYRLETDEGTASLADLFRGRSQLIVYHFMFGPEYTAGCPSCSAIADGFDGSIVHVANHDVTLGRVSRAPLANLQAYKRRMGWSFPWASSFESDFSYDFHVSHTEGEWQTGAVEYNFRTVDFRPAEESPVLAELASSAGTDFATYRREGPGMSAFALEDGLVYLGLRTRDRRPLGHVPVARPRTTRTQRDRHLVAPPRRVRKPLTPTTGHGCKHDTAAHRPLISAPERGDVGFVHEHRLDEHRQVLVSRRVTVRFADDRRNGCGDTADEKSRHIRLLPHGEVVAQDDRDLRVKLHPVTLATRAA